MDRGLKKRIIFSSLVLHRFVMLLLYGASVRALRRSSQMILSRSANVPTGQQETTNSFATERSRNGHRDIAIAQWAWQQWRGEHSCHDPNIIEAWSRDFEPKKIAKSMCCTGVKKQWPLDPLVTRPKKTSSKSCIEPFRNAIPPWAQIRPPRLFWSLNDRTMVEIQDPTNGKESQ